MLARRSNCRRRDSAYGGDVTGEKVVPAVLGGTYEVTLECETIFGQVVNPAKGEVVGVREEPLITTAEEPL